MRNLQVALGVIFGVLVFLFLDYALPSRHTVRVTNVYNQITDLGWNGIFYASPDTGTVQTADGRRGAGRAGELAPTTPPGGAAIEEPPGGLPGGSCSRGGTGIRCWGRLR